MHKFGRTMPRILAEELAEELALEHLNGASLDTKICHYISRKLPRALLCPNLSTDEKIKMAEAYLHGLNGAPQDAKHALWWFDCAAKDGDPSAQYQLGLLYESGSALGVEDDELAFSCFLQSAQFGYPEACVKVGKWFQTGRVPMEEEEANENSAAAAATAGVADVEGKRIILETSKENLEQGFQWMMKAVEKQFVEAQYEVGQCYEFGRGCPQSLSQAVTFYRMAASQGFAKAQYRMGMCYEKGEGVGAQDWFQAVRLYKLAAEQRDGEANLALGKCYEKGVGNLERCVMRAAVHYAISAGEGIAEGQYLFGLCCETGQGVPEHDKELALAWFKKAAGQGHVLAQEKLSRWHISNY